MPTVQRTSRTNRRSTKSELPTALPLGALRFALTINLRRSHTEVERQLRAKVYALQQQLAAGGGGAAMFGEGTVDAVEVEGIRREAELVSRNAAQLEAKVASLVRSHFRLQYSS